MSASSLLLGPQDFYASVLDVLTPDDVRILVEMEDEFSRRGQFERIFPSRISSRYLRFFEQPRYFNILTTQWEQKYHSNKLKGESRPCWQEAIFSERLNPSNLRNGVLEGHGPADFSLLSPNPCLSHPRSGSASELVLQRVPHRACL